MKLVADYSISPVRLIADEKVYFSGNIVLPDSLYGDEKGISAYSDGLIHACDTIALECRSRGVWGFIPLRELVNNGKPKARVCGNNQIFDFYLVKLIERNVHFDFSRVTYDFYSYDKESECRQIRDILYYDDYWDFNQNKKIYKNIRPAPPSFLLDKNHNSYELKILSKGTLRYISCDDINIKRNRYFFDADHFVDMDMIESDIKAASCNFGRKISLGDDGVGTLWMEFEEPDFEIGLNSVIKNVFGNYGTLDELEKNILQISDVAWDRFEKEVYGLIKRYYGSDELKYKEYKFPVHGYQSSHKCFVRLKEYPSAESKDIYLRYIGGYNYPVFAEKIIYDVYISHFEKA